MLDQSDKNRALIEKAWLHSLISPLLISVKVVQSVLVELAEQSPPPSLAVEHSRLGPSRQVNKLTWSSDLDGKG